MPHKTTEQQIPGDIKEFAAIKSALGQIFWDFIAMSADGKAIEGNPAVHRMAQWVYEKLHSLPPSPVGEAGANKRFGPSNNGGYSPDPFPDSGIIAHRELGEPHGPEPNIYCIADYPGNIFGVRVRISVKWNPIFQEWYYSDCSNEMLGSWFKKFPHLFAFTNSIFPPIPQTVVNPSRAGEIRPTFVEWLDKEIDLVKIKPEIAIYHKGAYQSSWAHVAYNLLEQVKEIYLSTHQPEVTEETTAAEARRNIPSGFDDWCQAHQRYYKDECPACAVT